MSTIADQIQNLTEELLKRMGIQFDKVILTQRDDVTYRINILTPDASLLIGHFGDTLKALQYVIKAAIAGMSEEPLFIICDVEGYKERQEEKVIEMAEKAVERLKKGGSSEEHLPTMSPYFRKVVHTHLKKYEADGINSGSEGEAEDRHIVVRK